MDEEIEVSEFDVWYQQLIAVLAVDGRRAPYKMAWIDLYEQGMTPEKAAPIGPYATVNE
ncbi:hypothetical protein NL822_12575 [Klebsiella quasipneumoniae]|jgi:hypothetical protein|uniref:hypothetical protein n=1 Tax=Klebsiella quasipneumoniae TaxID=1463165 RepID=UPI0020C4E78A|nr:hypothetical protein [Klebsiella quasipneumoniae]MCP6736409.1 hypothetical protein [Klebsiella quasipneumoniae]MCP6747219.1 hypothetical protein [Klebsiella quasipneumoniae]HCI6798102.1 hypothetical protein [Klebsiella quasipneumoniae subsp. quasipneumoniae]HCI6917662.1 hypothetical protein [Klebsiella quasipneumoniae subsp. similipneumoniae]